MAKYLEGKGPITVNFLTTFEGNLRITFYHIYAGKVLRKGFRTNKLEQKLALVLPMMSNQLTLPDFRLHLKVH